MKQLLVLCATALLIPATARAQNKPVDPAPEARTTYQLDGASLRVTPPQEGAEATAVALPCQGSALMAHKARLYVACGELGAVVLSVEDDPGAPKVIARKDLGGSVVGFFEVDGQVWARIARLEGRPVDQGLAITGPLIAEAPEMEVPEMPEPSEAPEVLVEGVVVALRTGSVVIDLGSTQGLSAGDRVELFARQEEDLGEGQAAVREVLLAVGVASVVAEGRSEVDLGLGERVPLGAFARPTDRKRTSNRLTPPRVPELIEVAFNLRPFLALGTFGFGTVSDGSVGYRTANNLHLQGLFEPIGLGLSDEGNVVALSTAGVVAYDTPLFEVGLGLGWSAVNDAIDDDSFEADLAAGGDGLTTDFDNVRSGLAIVQTIRLGALDGLNLSARNSFLFFKGQFHYGGTNASLQAPVSDRYWLMLGGGGGIAGYGYGEVGLRVLLVGNGDHGSLFLTPRLGGAGLFGEVVKEGVALEDCFGRIDSDGTCVEEIEYAGPMIGLGLEWRP